MSLNMATWPDDTKVGGLELRASAAAGADATADAVEIGKGKYRIVTTWTGCEVDDNDELYVITLEANTRYATSTWYEIGVLAVLGDSVATGRDTDNSSTGSVEIIVDNPYDYQVRVRTYVNGTITTGVTYSVTAYPLGRKA